MDKIGILKVGLDETVGFVTKYLNSSTDKNELLDPFSTLCKLALLSFHEEGTKISVDNNRIYFQDPGIQQTMTRWYNNYRREDLHQLMNPIKKLEEIYDVFSDPAFLYIIGLSIEGVEKLNATYVKSNKRTGTSVVLHSLEMYKTLLLNLYTRIQNKGEEKERRLSSLTEESQDLGEETDYPKPKNMDEFLGDYKSPGLKPADDNHSVEMSIYNEGVSPINVNYREFRSLWTYNEVQILQQLFLNTSICKEKKRPYEFNLKAIVAFLEGKDDLFKVIVKRLVTEL